MVDVMILKKIKCGESGQYGLTCTLSTRTRESFWNCLTPDRNHLKVRSHDLGTNTYRLYDISQTKSSTIR